MLQRSNARLMTVGVALVLLLGATFAGGALAGHDFPDVPSSAYYHNDVSWLVDNGITAGCGGGKYCPNAAVTRGQMAVFLHKLAGLADVAKTVSGADPVTTSATSFGDLAGATISISLPGADNRLIVASFAAESKCDYDNDGIPGFGRVRILIDSVEAAPVQSTLTDFAFDSCTTSSPDNYEAHAITRSLTVAPGSHTIQVQWASLDGQDVFRLDDWHLLVETKRIG